MYKAVVNSFVVQLLENGTLKNAKTIKHGFGKRARTAAAVKGGNKVQKCVCCVMKINFKNLCVH